VLRPTDVPARWTGTLNVPWAEDVPIVYPAPKSKGVLILRSPVTLLLPPVVPFRSVDPPTTNAPTTDELPPVVPASGRPSPTAPLTVELPAVDAAIE